MVARVQREQFGGAGRGRRRAREETRGAFDRIVARRSQTMSAPLRLVGLALSLLVPQYISAVQIFVHPRAGADASTSFTREDGTPLRTLKTAQAAVRLALAQGAAEVVVQLHPGRHVATPLNLSLWSTGRFCIGILYRFDYSA